MKKFIIKINSNGQTSYLCNWQIQPFKVLQTSTSYSTGTREFDSIEEATIIADKIKDAEIVHVN